MNRQSLFRILDSCTYASWVGIGFLTIVFLRLTFLGSKILIAVYLAFSRKIPALDNLNEKLAAEYELFFRGFDSAAAFRAVSSFFSAVDIKLKQSCLARRIFFILLIVLAVFYAFPPSHWGRWHLYEKGTASFYGKGFYMNRTAGGELFLPFGGMTAAHKKLPMGTVVLIRNMDNGKEAVARINDRGPFVGHRNIDLSVAVAKELGMKNDGLAKVEIYTRKNFGR